MTNEKTCFCIGPDKCNDKNCKLIKMTTDETRMCFCIGPDKCNDKNCKLVKEYNEKNNNIIKPNKFIS